MTEGRLNSDSYTPAEAALILGVTPTRVRQLLQEGEFEGERDEVGHWSIPARAVHDRLERLRRERFVEAVGADPLSVRALQERVVRSYSANSDAWRDVWRRGKGPTTLLSTSGQC